MFENIYLSQSEQAQIDFLKSLIALENNELVLTGIFERTEFRNLGMTVFLKFLMKPDEVEISDFSNHISSSVSDIDLDKIEVKVKAK